MMLIMERISSSVMAALGFLSRLVVKRLWVEGRLLEAGCNTRREKVSRFADREDETFRTDFLIQGSFLVL